MLGESGFLNYSKVFGFKCCIVRYHNVYGPRMGFKHVIPHLAERFINNENPFHMYGHDQTRSFCYIDDAVKATVLAIENNNSNGQIYHVGTEDEIKIEELIRKCGDFFGYKGTYINAPTYPGSTNRRCPDISKSKNELGYAPKVRLEDGLKKTLTWYRDFFTSGSSAYESSFTKPKL